MKILSLGSGGGTGLKVYDATTLQTPAGHPNLRVQNLTVTGTAVISSTTTSTGQFLSANGTAGAPGYSSTNDPNTGIFFNADDTMRFSMGGTERFRGTTTGLDLGANQLIGGASIGSGDAFFERVAAATWQFGAADAAAPVAQTVKFQGARGGTDTNTAGVNATFTPSLGTGTGALGSLILQIAVAAGSGTGQHTTATGLRVRGDATFTDYPCLVVASGTPRLFLDTGVVSFAYASHGVPDSGIYGTVGVIHACNGTYGGAGDFGADSSALTASTMTYSSNSLVRKAIHKFSWTNAMITALGAVTAGDVQVCTLPAKTVVTNCYVVLLTADSSANALTGAVGRVSASYIDYIVASDMKAAANTVYGDASGERGTNLTGYDLPSYTATTGVFMHFIKTTTNLNTVTGCTGVVYLETMTLP